MKRYFSYILFVLACIGGSAAQADLIPLAPPPGQRYSVTGSSSALVLASTGTFNNLNISSPTTGTIFLNCSAKTLGSGASLRNVTTCTTPGTSSKEIIIFISSSNAGIYAMLDLFKNEVDVTADNGLFVAPTKAGSGVFGLSDFSGASYWELLSDPVNGLLFQDFNTTNNVLTIANGAPNNSLAMDASGNSSFVSSVTASAFFGDGSHLTGLAVARSTGSFSADLSASAAITSAAGYGQCVQNSTVSFINDGINPTIVGVYGTLSETGSSPYIGWNFLVDSGYVDGLTTLKGAGGTNVYSGTGIDIFAGPEYVIPAGTLGAGSHTFCLQLFGGTGNTVQTGCHFGAASTTCKTKFGAHQLH